MSQSKADEIASLGSDQTLRSSSNNHNSESQLVSQLYNLLLCNDYIQTGKDHITRISEPILAKFRFYREEGLHSLQEKGSEVVGEGRNLLKNLLFTPTIYNHLVGAWLIKNTPYDGKVYSFEEFFETFKNIRGVNPKTQIDDRNLNSFYEHARVSWVTMKDPSSEDIRDKCLLIGAEAIAHDNNINNAEFGKAAVETFLFITTEKNHVPSFETYLSILTARAGDSDYKSQDNFVKAARTFFMFAKRFCFVEYPSIYSNKNLFHFLVQFTKGTIDVSAELVLMRLDRILTSLINLFHVSYEDEEAPINLLDRIHTIVVKAKALATQASQKSFKAIQDTTSYKLVDHVVNLDQRYNEFKSLINIIYDYSEHMLMDSTKQAISYLNDKVSNQYVVIMRDVSEEFIKAQYQGLVKRYDFLKNATMNLKGKVLELRFDKEGISSYKENIKDQILTLYEEIRDLDINKIKIYGSKMYSRALKNIKNPSSSQADKIIEENTKSKGSKKNQRNNESQADKIIEEYNEKDDQNEQSEEEDQNEKSQADKIIRENSEKDDQNKQIERKGKTQHNNQNKKSQSDKTVRKNSEKDNRNKRQERKDNQNNKSQADKIIEENSEKENQDKKLERRGQSSRQNDKSQADKIIRENSEKDNQNKRQERKDNQNNKSQADKIIKENSGRDNQGKQPGDQSDKSQADKIIEQNNETNQKW